MVYVLTHEYADKSGFHICGVTESSLVADTWFRANDENNIYEFNEIDLPPQNWMTGVRGWAQQDMNRGIKSL